MKVVLFSGAGLSAPSGIPTYNEIKLDPVYSRFFSMDDANAIEALDDIRNRLNGFNSNVAHRECVKFQKFCEAIDVEFVHYTLNVDNLIELSGGNAFHIYGCVNDTDSVMNHRFSPSVEMDALDWKAGDILVFIGMSDNGYPIAYLESIVMNAGGIVYHYNLTKRDDLFGEQIVGDIASTLSALKLSMLIPIEFDVVDIGAYEVHVKVFTIGNNVYEVFFSPSLEYYSDPDEIDLIEQHTGYSLDDNAYEVKFDLQSNRLEGNSFNRPSNNLSISDLWVLGLVMVRVMYSHEELVGGSLYTASAAYPELVSFYNRLARKYRNKLHCECWCAFGPKGVSYAFKT